MIGKYRENMEADLKMLMQSIAEKEKVLSRMSPESLSCYKDGNGYKWVRNHNEVDESGNTHRKRTYIHKDREDLASKLAYRTYLSKLIKDEKQELNAIESYLNKSSSNNSALEYLKRNPELTRLLYPYTKKWDVNAEIWRSTPNEVKNSIPIEHPLKTKGGEIVRSKGEVIICDRLYDFGIPYRVEKPVDVSSAYRIIQELGISYSGKRYHYLFPDITILDKYQGEIIWEHMGLCSDASYMQRNCNKILLYSLVGYRPFKNFIMSFEDEQQYIDTALIDQLIDHYLVH